MEECPTCGDTFETVAGMKRHHALAHGESIAGVDVECSVCGTVVRKRPHEVEDHEHNVCSESCRREVQSRASSGESNPNYKGGKSEYECHHCCGTVYKWESVAQQSERHFCSEDCRKEWQSQFFSGEDSPRWSKKGIQCAECGTEIQRSEWKIDSYEHSFCSAECKNAFHSKQISGKDNPNWGHGRSDTHVYGSDWPNVRKSILERDGHECAVCGLSDDAHRRSYRGGLEIHHITPIAEFESSERANRKENLVALCSRCHGRVEHGGEHIRDKLAVVARTRSRNQLTV